MELTSVDRNLTGEFRNKGSKFYGFVFPIESEDHFREVLSKNRKQYHDATHHCWAYRFCNTRNIIEHYSDDGEPAGTAGLPILNALRSSDLIQIGAIVVRYYGGSNLGKPGLIEAYGQAIGNAIESTDSFTKLMIGRLFILDYSYEMTNTVRQLIDNTSIKVISANYSDEIKQHVAIPTESIVDFKMSLRSLDSRYVKFTDTEESVLVKL